MFCIVKFFHISLHTAFDCHKFIGFTLTPSWVTIDTVFICVDIDFDVIIFHFLVLVTAVAWVFGVSIFVASFTSEARDIGLFTMVYQECVNGKLSRHPGSCDMTAFALDSKYTHMNFGIFVAPGTFSGRARKYSVSMALCTFRVLMFTLQCIKMVVFEIGHAVGAIVAGNTVRSKFIHMFSNLIVFFVNVAGNTIQGSLLRTDLDCGSFHSSWHCVRNPTGDPPG